MKYKLHTRCMNAPCPHWIVIQNQIVQQCAVMLVHTPYVHTPIYVCMHVHVCACMYMYNTPMASSYMGGG